MTTAPAGHDVETLGRALAELAAAPHYSDWLFDRARPYLGRRVLDAGAGHGAFTARAASAGADVVALEPEPEFAALLRERFDRNDAVTVVEGTAERPPAGIGGGFDSVLCLNVLEHIENDAEALRAFHGLLAPAGRLLLLVPAHRRLYGAYDRAAGHARRYEAEGLRRLLATTGFAVETVRYVNPLGAIGWLVRVRLLRDPSWPAGAFAVFDRLVPAVRHLDRLRLPFGLSLWAVARKSNR